MRRLMLARALRLSLVHAALTNAIAPRYITNNATSATSVTTSSYNPLITAPPTGNCVANCTAIPWAPLSFEWIAQYPNVTLTAATVIYEINNATNTTSTTTIYNDLPSGYTRPPTNSAGYRIQPVTYPIYSTTSGTCSSSWPGMSGFYLPCNISLATTTLTFPTIYVDFPESYELTGIIPTTIDGSSSCLDAPTGTWLPFPASMVTPTPVSLTSTNTDDPYGLLYTVTADPGAYFQANWHSAYPSEAAFSLCSTWNLESPESALFTASLVTPTLTNYISSRPSTSSKLPTITYASAHTELSTTGLETLTAHTEDIATGLATNDNAPATTSTVPGQITTTSFPIYPSAHTEDTQTNLITAGQVHGTSQVAGAGFTTTTANPQVSSVALPDTESTSHAAQNPGAGGSSTTANAGGVIASILAAGQSSTQGSQGGSNSAPTSAQGGAAGVFTAASQTFSALGSSVFVAGSQTLAVGQSITLGSGAATTVVALQTGAEGSTRLVVAGSTSALPTSSTPASSEGAGTAAAVFTVAGQTFSPLGTSALVVNGQTLAPGSSVTLVEPAVSGSLATSIVLALTTDSAGATAVVVGGSSTVVVPAGTSAAGSGIAAAIMSLFSAEGTASATGTTAGGLGGTTAVGSGASATTSGGDGQTTVSPAAFTGAGNTVIDASLTLTLAMGALAAIGMVVL